MEDVWEDGEQPEVKPCPLQNVSSYTVETAVEGFTIINAYFHYILLLQHLDSFRVVFYSIKFLFLTFSYSAQFQYTPSLNVLYFILSLLLWCQIQDDMAALHFTKFFLCIAYFHYAPFYTPLTFILSIVL
jgi:hypothetical protein